MAEAEGSYPRPLCTVAIAMINSLGPGDPLPGQPAGLFGSSDTSTIRQIAYSDPDPLGKVFTQCLRADFWVPQIPVSLGWAQAGKWQLLDQSIKQAHTSLTTFHQQHRKCGQHWNFLHGDDVRDGPSDHTSYISHFGRRIVGWQSTALGY